MAGIKLDQILLKVRNGDEPAFSELIEHIRKVAFNQAYRYTHDYEKARDLVQEALLTCWSKREKMPDQIHFTAWFLTIIRNKAIDEIRKRRLSKVPLNTNHQSLAAPVNPSSDDYERFYELILIWTSKLPNAQRKVFLLRDIEGKSLAEVIQETGLSEGSVKTNLYLARKKLNRFLVANEIITNP